MTDTLTETITVSLRVENRYEYGPMVVTTPTDKVVPAPPAGAEPGDTEFEDWAYDHLYPFTGTGQESGDSFYDVEVTASTDPALVGVEFAWGY